MNKTRQMTTGPATVDSTLVLRSLEFKAANTEKAP